MKIGNNFNELITTVSKNLALKINTTKNFNDYLDPKQDDSLFTLNGENEIESYIKTLDSKNPVIFMGCPQNF